MLRYDIVMRIRVSCVFGVISIVCRAGLIMAVTVVVLSFPVTAKSLGPNAYCSLTHSYQKMVVHISLGSSAD